MGNAPISLHLHRVNCNNNNNNNIFASSRAKSRSRSSSQSQGEKNGYCCNQLTSSQLQREGEREEERSWFLQQDTAASTSNSRSTSMSQHTASMGTISRQQQQQQNLQTFSSSSSFQHPSLLPPSLKKMQHSTHEQLSKVIFLKDGNVLLGVSRSNNVTCWQSSSSVTAAPFSAENIFLQQQQEEGEAEKRNQMGNNSTNLLFTRMYESSVRSFLPEKNIVTAIAAEKFQVDSSLLLKGSSFHSTSGCKLSSSHKKGASSSLSTATCTNCCTCYIVCVGTRTGDVTVFFIPATDLPVTTAATPRGPTLSSDGAIWAAAAEQQQQQQRVLSKVENLHKDRVSSIGLQLYQSLPLLSLRKKEKEHDYGPYCPDDRGGSDVGVGKLVVFSGGGDGSLASSFFSLELREEKKIPDKKYNRKDFEDEDDDVAPAGFFSTVTSNFLQGKLLMVSKWSGPEAGGCPLYSISPLPPLNTFFPSVVVPNHTTTAQAAAAANIFSFSSETTTAFLGKDLQQQNTPPSTATTTPREQEKGCCILCPCCQFPRVRVSCCVGKCIFILCLSVDAATQNMDDEEEERSIFTNQDKNAPSTMSLLLDTGTPYRNCSHDLHVISRIVCDDFVSCTFVLFSVSEKKRRREEGLKEQYDGSAGDAAWGQTTVSARSPRGVQPKEKAPRVKSPGQSIFATRTPRSSRHDADHSVERTYYPEFIREKNEREDEEFCAFDLTILAGFDRGDLEIFKVKLTDNNTSVTEQPPAAEAEIDPQRSTAAVREGKGKGGVTLKFHKGRVTLLRIAPGHSKTVNHNNRSCVGKKNCYSVHEHQQHKRNKKEENQQQDHLLFLSVGEDCTVALWKLQNFIGSAGFSYSNRAKGRNNIVAGAEGARTTTSTLVCTVTRHTNLISDAHFGPKRKYFASCSLDGTVRFWRLDGTLIVCLRSGTASSSGTATSIGNSTRPFSSSSSFSSVSNTCTAPMAMMKSGTTTTSAAAAHVSGSPPSKRKCGDDGLLFTEKESILSLAFHPSGKCFVTCGGNGMCRAWRTPVACSGLEEWTPSAFPRGREGEKKETQGLHVPLPSSLSTSPSRKVDLPPRLLSPRGRSSAMQNNNNNDKEESRLLFMRAASSPATTTRIISSRSEIYDPVAPTPIPTATTKGVDREQQQQQAKKGVSQSMVGNYGKGQQTTSLITAEKQKTRREWKSEKDKRKEFLPKYVIKWHTNRPTNSSSVLPRIEEELSQRNGYQMLPSEKRKEKGVRSLSSSVSTSAVSPDVTMDGTMISSKMWREKKNSFGRANSATLTWTQVKQVEERTEPLSGTRVFRQQEQELGRREPQASFLAQQQQQEQSSSRQTSTPEAKVTASLKSNKKNTSSPFFSNRGNNSGHYNTNEKEKDRKNDHDHERQEDSYVDCSPIISRSVNGSAYTDSLTSSSSLKPEEADDGDEVEELKSTKVPQTQHQEEEEEEKRARETRKYLAQCLEDVTVALNEKTQGMDQRKKKDDDNNNNGNDYGGNKNKQEQADSNNKNREVRLYRVGAAKQISKHSKEGLTSQQQQKRQVSESKDIFSSSSKNPQNQKDSPSGVFRTLLIQEDDSGKRCEESKERKNKKEHHRDNFLDVSPPNASKGPVSYNGGSGKTKEGGCPQYVSPLRSKERTRQEEEEEVTCLSSLSPPYRAYYVSPTRKGRCVVPSVGKKEVKKVSPSRCHPQNTSNNTVSCTTGDNHNNIFFSSSSPMSSPEFQPPRESSRERAKEGGGGGEDSKGKQSGEREHSSRASFERSEKSKRSSLILVEQEQKQQRKGEEEKEERLLLQGVIDIFPSPFASSLEYTENTAASTNNTCAPTSASTLPRREEKEGCTAKNVQATATEEKEKDRDTSQRSSNQFKQQQQQRQSDSVSHSYSTPLPPTSNTGKNTRCDEHHPSNKFPTSSSSGYYDISPLELYYLHVQLLLHQEDMEEKMKKSCQKKEKEKQLQQHKESCAGDDIVLHEGMLPPHLVKQKMKKRLEQRVKILRKLISQHQLQHSYNGEEEERRNKNFGSPNNKNNPFARGNLSTEAEFRAYEMVMLRAQNVLSSSFLEEEKRRRKGKKATDRRSDSEHFDVIAAEREKGSSAPQTSHCTTEKEKKERGGLTEFFNPLNAQTKSEEKGIIYHASSMMTQYEDNEGRRLQNGILGHFIFVSSSSCGGQTDVSFSSDVCVSSLCEQKTGVAVVDRILASSVSLYEEIQRSLKKIEQELEYTGGGEMVAYTPVFLRTASSAGGAGGGECSQAFCSGRFSNAASPLSRSTTSLMSASTLSSPSIIASSSLLDAGVSCGSSASLSRHSKKDPRYGSGSPDHCLLSLLRASSFSSSSSSWDPPRTFSRHVACVVDILISKKSFSSSPLSAERRSLFLNSSGGVTSSSSSSFAVGKESNVQQQQQQQHPGRQTAGNGRGNGSECEGAWKYVTEKVTPSLMACVMGAKPFPAIFALTACSPLILDIKNLCSFVKEETSVSKDSGTTGKKRNSEQVQKEEEEEEQTMDAERNKLWTLLRLAYIECALLPPLGSDRWCYKGCEEYLLPASLCLSSSSNRSHRIFLGENVVVATRDAQEVLAALAVEQQQQQQNLSYSKKRIEEEVEERNASTTVTVGTLILIRSRHAKSLSASRSSRTSTTSSYSFPTFLKPEIDFMNNKFSDDGDQEKEDQEKEGRCRGRMSTQEHFSASSSAVAVPSTKVPHPSEVILGGVETDVLLPPLLPLRLTCWFEYRGGRSSTYISNGGSVDSEGKKKEEEEMRSDTFYVSPTTSVSSSKTPSFGDIGTQSTEKQQQQQRSKFRTYFQLVRKLFEDGGMGSLCEEEGREGAEAPTTRCKSGRREERRESCRVSVWVLED